MATDDVTRSVGGKLAMFTVDSVATFHDQRHPSLQVVEAPSEIPGGFMATYKDAGGTTIYVIDQSTDAEVE